MAGRQPNNCMHLDITYGIQQLFLFLVTSQFSVKAMAQVHQHTFIFENLVLRCLCL